MKRILALFSVVLLMAVMLCGCAKRAAEDAADTVSNAVSDVKEDADRYGKTDDDTDGHIDDPTIRSRRTIRMPIMTILLTAETVTLRRWVTATVISYNDDKIDNRAVT